MLYVLVVIEHGTRRLAHFNVTAHPSAAWTLQQLREVVADTDRHKYLVHDRDSIFARHLDESIRALGLGVLLSPLASPKANAICERVIGTIRRECLDWMIPLSELHLRSILREWVSHYNGGRLTARWGPAYRDLFQDSCSRRNLNPDIDGCRERGCERNLSWADCTRIQPRDRTGERVVEVDETRSFVEEGFGCFAILRTSLLRSTGRQAGLRGPVPPPAG